MAENGIKPEEFEVRIIFMSMYSDVDWTTEGNFKKCVSNSMEVKAYAHRFPKRHIGHPSDQERKKSGMERTPTSPKVCGTVSQKLMILISEKADIPSVSTERSRIGVKNCLCKSQIIRFPARGNPWRR